MSGPVLLVLRIILIAALYAFVGWALVTLWQDLQRQSKLLAVPKTPPLVLSMVSDGDERTFRFSSPVITIGRDPVSDCHLEDQTISAQHSRLSYHHGQWWVEDLHSTNGTFLNQDPVHEPLVVTTGDQLRCGQVLLQISFGESDARRVETSI